jgi:hypothetical protein
MIGPLRSPEAGALDFVSVMAYEAGPSYSPWTAFEAYRALWPGPLALGVQVPLTGKEVPRYTEGLTRDLAARVAGDERGGMMLYGLFGRPRGAVTADNADGRTLARAICAGLGRAGCQEPVP